MIIIGCIYIILKNIIQIINFKFIFFIQLFLDKVFQFIDLSSIDIIF